MPTANENPTPTSPPAAHARRSTPPLPVLALVLLAFGGGLTAGYVAHGPRLVPGETPPAATNEEDRDAIEALQRERVRLFNVQDVDGMLAQVVTEGAHFFHVIPPLEYDRKEFGQDFHTLYSKFDVPSVMTLGSVKVTLGSGDLAYARAVLVLKGVKRSGLVVDMDMRVTSVLRKTGNLWRIEHEHWSVPVDPETKRAFLNQREMPN